VFSFARENKFDKFSIKNSLKHVLEYTIRRVQAGQGDLKFDGSRHVLVYADSVDLLGERVPVTREIQKLNP
jgi:hypothetical protein